MWYFGSGETMQKLDRGLIIGKKGKLSCSLVVNNEKVFAGFSNGQICCWKLLDSEFLSLNTIVGNTLIKAYQSGQTLVDFD